MIPNSCLWSLGNVQFALVIRASSVLILPDTAKKDFSPLIRRFLYRMLHWNAFQALKTPYHQPEQREEYAGHWCLCHHNRGCWCGKEVSMAFLSKEVLGWSPYIFVYVQSNHVAWNLVLWSFFDDHSVLFVSLTLCSFPHLCKQGIVMPHLPSAERWTRLKWHSCNGNSLDLTRAPRQRVTNLFVVP